METTTAVIVGGVYLLFLGLFFFLWFQFREMKRSYWDKRNFDYVKEPIKPVDLTPRPINVRYKPKHRSDEKLFEIEQNPAKQ